MNDVTIDNMLAVAHVHSASMRMRLQWGWLEEATEAGNILLNFCY